MKLRQTAPVSIEAHVAYRLPDEFRRAKRSDWADANASGAHLDSFLEAPVQDAEGNLYVVDIPHGRIFQINARGHWNCVVEYDGWPNGMALAADGTMLVCDYRHGLMQLELNTGRIRPLLETRNSERFKGTNHEPLREQLLDRLPDRRARHAVPVGDRLFVEQIAGQVAALGQFRLDLFPDRRREVRITRTLGHCWLPFSVIIQYAPVITTETSIIL